MVASPPGLVGHTAQDRNAMVKNVSDIKIHSATPTRVPSIFSGTSPVYMSPLNHLMLSRD